MQRVAPGKARHIHQLVYTKITLARWRGANWVGFIGQTNMQRGAVKIAIDRDGTDAHLAAGPQDADRDFPAIGDQNLLEHEMPLTAGVILARGIGPSATPQTWTPQGAAGNNSTVSEEKRHRGGTRLLGGYLLALCLYQIGIYRWPG